MITATVTAEYNPMHTAHVMQLDMIRKKTGADALVVLLSGNFVQRGGPAIVDKYARAHSALSAGADLVVCLPYVYAAQTAEIFARGAVGIADKIRTNYFCFGCEEERFIDIEKMALVLNGETLQMSEQIKKLMYVEKLPYAAARLFAAAGEAGLSESEFLRKPNNILALEYLRAAFYLRAQFKVAPNGIISEGYRTASELRKALLSGNTNEYCSYFRGNKLPEAPYRRFDEYNFIFKAFLSSLPQKMLIACCEGDEALAIRLRNLAALLGESTERFLAAAVTKNYTRSRIRRNLVNMAVNYTKEDMAFFRNYTPEYLQVLGADNLGCKLINEVNEQGLVTLTGNLNKHCRDFNPYDKRLFEVEQAADNLYKLFTDEFDTEMKRPPIII